MGEHAIWRRGDDISAISDPRPADSILCLGESAEAGVYAAQKARRGQQGQANDGRGRTESEEKEPLKGPRVPRKLSDPSLAPWPAAAVMQLYHQINQGCMPAAMGQVPSCGAILHLYEPLADSRLSASLRRKFCECTADTADQDKIIRSISGPARSISVGVVCMSRTMCAGSLARISRSTVPQAEHDLHLRT